MQTEYLTLVADFKAVGRFAYLSHQETLSFWQRVLVRAQVPLVYSQGFNPRPKMSLPLPRSVGVQSDCERLCARISAEGFCGIKTCRAIRLLLPDGGMLDTCGTLPGRAVFYPVSVTYRFALCTVPDTAHQEHLQHCLEQLDNNKPIDLLRRLAKGRQQPVDIRPFLDALTVEDSTLHVVCAIRPAGTVRIDELMRWLGLEPSDLAEPVRRVAVQWAPHIPPLQGEYKLS